MRIRFLPVPLLLCLALLAGFFSGCGAVGPEKGKLSVVATVFPLWDWTREILGGGAEEEISLTLLLDNGTDLHSYQPTVDDLVTISSADLLIYVGGESDGWIEDALSEKANPDLIALNLMEVLGDRRRLEERVEGMRGGAEEAEYDEHIWLSLKNAEVCCAAIADALAQLSPGLAETAAENTAAYFARLEALDARYRETTDAAARKMLLFADRFPFRYLLDDYGLSYYAAFAGCEAETGASFETVVFLAEKINALGLPAVLTTDSPVPRLAETIVANTRNGNEAIFELDSMQSVTRSDIEGGASYLGIMVSNLEILKEALR